MSVRRNMWGFLVGAAVATIGCSSDDANGAMLSAGGANTSESAPSTGSGDEQDTANADDTTDATDNGGAVTGADTTGPGGDSSESSGDSTGPGITDPPPLQGYGTDSTFGSGGEICMVTNLDASGPGSLLDCATNRDTQDDNPTPREVFFDVEGTITLDTTLLIRQPYLTIDATTAREPGITIQQVGDGSTGDVGLSTWANNGTCAHDVLIRGLRVVGTWTPAQGDDVENEPTLSIDGENVPGCIHHVVFDRVTVFGAQDSGGDIWGGVTDVTFQYSAFLSSYHPNTWSHFPGGEAGQGRERISAHHNLYANNQERNPQLRASNSDVNYEQNIVHNWDTLAAGYGYGIRVRCRNGACPQRLNFIANHFTQASNAPAGAMVFGEPDIEGPDDASIPGAVYMADNRFPDPSADWGTAAAQFPRPPIAVVDLVEPDALTTTVLPFVGAPYRTPAEEAIFEAVATAVESEL